MKRLLLSAGVIGLSLGVGASAQNPANDWPTVGNDPGGMKYSPLTQITPANVTRLAKAWTYDTGAPASGYTVTPIVVSNVMYLPVRGSTIVALRADSGTEIWKFDLATIAALGPTPSAGGRGISYWPGRRGRAS
jgi:quinoprotein glucose dehydrogenase